MRAYANICQEAWRVLAKLANIRQAPCCADSPVSLTFAKPCYADSPNSRHSPSHFASTRQTRQHSPKAIFEKNVTRLAKFARVIRETRADFASSHCLAIA